jgi:hypothetical protein
MEQRFSTLVYKKPPEPYVPPRIEWRANPDRRWWQFWKPKMRKVYWYPTIAAE